jgi:hypothetical protein
MPNSHTNYLSAATAPGSLNPQGCPNPRYLHPVLEGSASTCPCLRTPCYVPRGMACQIGPPWPVQHGPHNPQRHGPLLPTHETKKNPDRLCEPCVMANAKRDPSPTSKNPPTTRILELIHTDLAGPYATTSYDGKRCVLIVLDDFTKISSVKCLKHKDDVTAALIHICNSLKN